MTINYRTETVEKQVVESVTCDVCRRTYDDALELQEFLHWRNTGGYSSIFGDGSVLELDLCQKCQQELLGGYIRVVDCDDTDGMWQQYEVICLDAHGGPGWSLC